MTTKKSKPKKSAPKKTFLQKIGEKASHLKDELIAGKDHLVEVAGDAFDSVKSSIQHITEKKKTPAKKKTAKKTASKPAKPAAKKTVKKAAVKKSATTKKVAKKAARKK